MQISRRPAAVTAVIAILLCVATLTATASSSGTQFAFLPGAGAIFRSNVTTGSWNSAASWTLVSGTDGDGIPDADDDVFIQSGHTISLTQSEAAFDVHVSTGTTSAAVGSEGVIALGTNTLSINGKIRCYFAPVGTTPGTTTNSVGPTPFTMTAASAGKLSFVGNSRNITTTGEWGAGNTASTTTFGIEINMTAGQTATMQTSIKASSWNVSSGTLDAGTSQISADNGTVGQGDITIAAGATVISNTSGNGQNVFQKTANARAGTLTVNGTLQLTGTSPNIAVNAIAFNGLVEYARSGSQNLAIAQTNAAGAAPNTYTNLKLSGTSTKTLTQNTTVNGTLTMAGDGTVAMALNGFTLTYGASSTLEYAASAAQTTAATEFPASGGPPSLKINNSSGVTLSASRTINGLLTLTSGNLTTGANVLILDCVATTSGGGASSYVNGNLRKTLCGNSGTSFTFPVGNSGYAPVSLTGISLGADPSTLTVSTTPSRLYPVNTNALYRYWTIDETGDVTASLAFNYPDSDTTGGTEANYRVYRSTGGPATDLCPSGPCVNAATNVLTPEAAVSDFGFFTGMEPSAPTGGEVSMSGRVVTADGQGVYDARIVISGTGTGARIYGTTGPFGYFRIDGLDAGQSYVVTVTSKTHTFTQSNKVITLNDSVTDLVFTANP